MDLRYPLLAAGFFIRITSTSQSETRNLTPVTSFLAIVLPRAHDRNVSWVDRLRRILQLAIARLPRWSPWPCPSYHRL